MVPLPSLHAPTVRVPATAPLRGGEAGETEHFEIHSGSEGEVKVEIESESDSDSSAEQQDPPQEAAESGGVLRGSATGRCSNST